MVYSKNALSSVLDYMDIFFRSDIPKENYGQFTFFGLRQDLDKIFFFSQSVIKDYMTKTDRKPIRQKYRQKLYYWKVQETVLPVFYLIMIVGHESLKECLINSHFENMRADFLRRCQNLLSFVKAIIVVGEKPEIVIKWSTPSIVQFVSDHVYQTIKYILSLIRIILYHSVLDSTQI